MSPRTARISRRSRLLAANPARPVIFDVPKDIMLLISDLLLPADILSLYRSCKTLHTSLQEEGSESFWKTARANVEGLPERPNWLTEQQFASICFDDFCCRCLAVDESSKNALWSFGARYCVVCKDERLTAKNPLEDLPLSGVLAGFRFRSAEIFPIFPSYLVENDEYTWVDYFHVPDVEKFREELAVTISLEDVSRNPTNEVVLSPAVEASVLSLLNEKQADTKERYKFAAKCRTWLVQWKLRQRVANIAIKSKRRLDILKHLQDLGYADEVRDLGIGFEGFSGEVLQVVNQARPLTSREWNAIRPVFIVFMDQRRELESRAKYVRLIVSRLRLLQTTLFQYLHEGARKDKRFDGARVFPTLLDLLDVRDAAQLISLPDGAILLPQLWIACLPKFITAWEEGRAGLLISIHNGLDPSSSTAHAHVSTSTDIHPIAARIRSAVPCLPLLHPSALFWCDICTSIVPGVVAMSHACCYGRGGEDSQDILSHLNPTIDGTYSQSLIAGDSESYFFKKTVAAFSEGILPWSHANLHACLPVVRSILRACDIVVGDLLKELRIVEAVRFACKSCSEDGKCVLVMGWLRAVAHSFEVHGGQEGSWVVIPPRLVEKVKNVEYAARKRIDEDTHARARWECSRCTWEQPEAGIAYTWPQLAEHFASCHPFTELNQTWYRASQDSPPFMHPAVLLVQRGAQGDIDHGAEDASFPRKHLVVEMKLAAETWSRLSC